MNAALRLVVAIASVSIFAIAPARSQDEAQAHIPDGPRLGIEAYGGWSLYAMGSLNDSLRSLNRQIGTRLDPIDGGPAWGFGVRIWPNPDFLLRVGFERLRARSEDSRVRFDMGTYVYSACGTYFIPTRRRLRYGFGLGVSEYYPFGGIGVSSTELSAAGEGLGGRVSAETILPMNAGWSLNGVLGYRWGRASQLRFGSVASDLETDYTGVFLRLGFALEMQARVPPVLLRSLARGADP